MPKKYYAMLSGLHPTLPLEELTALLESTNSQGIIKYNYDGVSIIEGKIDANSIIARSGYIKEIGELLDIYEINQIDYESIREKIKQMGIKDARIKAARYKGYSNFIKSQEIEIKLAREIEKIGINASTKSNNLIKVIITEGVAIVGLTLSKQINNFKINAEKRPFKRAGQIDQQLARVMVNLSRLKENNIFLDPFCGTGSLSLEACLLNSIKIFCFDLDPEMIYGSKLNLTNINCCKFSLVARHDIRSIPLKDESIDSIATDPPYGRATSTKKRGYENIVISFLEESMRILKKGSYLVYAGPSSEEPYKYVIDLGFKLIGFHDMFVHSGLNREIVIARKI
ncbi:MAG: RsmD family RNA methyltransferase [Caldisphaera sp.]|nr:TRM11 family methyltransferase [Caldisphaera sp.]PMP59417.1 MAG: hypothetical protein C0201_04800 [Caldisphaera sp.]